MIKGAAGNVEEAARARVERRVGTCERGGTDARELRAAAEVEVEAARSVGDLDAAAVSLARLRLEECDEMILVGRALARAEEGSRLRGGAYGAELFLVEFFAAVAVGLALRRAGDR